jgi:acyl-coenzyme A synthetase/AMP-(fatty) acid ligase
MLCLLPKVAEPTAIVESLLDHLKRHLPAFMVPAHIDVRDALLPRNANGKIDRKALQTLFLNQFAAEP